MGEIESITEQLFHEKNGFIFIVFFSRVYSIPRSADSLNLPAVFIFELEFFCVHSILKKF